MKYRPALLGIGLPICFIAFAAWWGFFRAQPPGYSATVLAVVAYIATLRPRAGGMERLLWFVVVLSFLLCELRAIRIDKTATERASSERIAHENASFKNLLNEFERTQLQIDTTLHAANVTIEQTRPRAIVVLKGVEYGPSNLANANLDPASKLFATNDPPTYAFDFQNIGTATATNLYKYGEMMFVKQSESALVSAHHAFLGTFKRSRRGPSLLLPGDGRAEDEAWDFLPNAATLQGFQKGALRAVFFFRAEYADDTGHWGTEACRIVGVPQNIALKNGSILTIGNEVQCPPRFNFSHNALHGKTHGAFTNETSTAARRKSCADR